MAWERIFKTALWPHPYLPTSTITDSLELCHQSLQAMGLNAIADGKLLDLLRRLETFGSHLVTLDIRQESTRHSDVIGEITEALGLGDYQTWFGTGKTGFS